METQAVASTFWDLRVLLLLLIKLLLASFCSVRRCATSFVYAAASSLFRSTLTSFAAFLALSLFLCRTRG